MKATLRKLLPILITVCVIASVAVIGAVTAGATTYTVPSDAVRIGNQSATFNTANGVYYISGGFNDFTGDKTLRFAANSELYLDNVADGNYAGFLIDVAGGVTLKIHLIGNNIMTHSTLNADGTIEVDGDGTLRIQNVWWRDGVVGEGEFVLNEGTVSVDTVGYYADEISVGSLVVNGGTLNCDDIRSENIAINGGTITPAPSGMHKATIELVNAKFADESTTKDVYATEGATFSVDYTPATGAQNGSIIVNGGDPVPMTNAQTTHYDGMMGDSDMTVKIVFETKQAITITLESKTWVYDNQDHSNAELSNETVTANGHHFNVTNFTVVHDVTTASVANEITYKILDADDNDVTDLYDITENFGFLMVTTRDYKLITGTNVLTYNGLPQTYEVWELDWDLLDRDELVVSNWPTVTHVSDGAVDNIPTVIKVMREGVDVTSNYRISIPPQNTGKISIGKAPATVSAGSTQIQFADGVDLEHNVLIGIAGFANGENPVVTLTTDYRPGDAPGSYDIVPAVTSITDGDINDYTITPVKGTLTVSKRAVTIKTGSKTWVYDAAAHSEETFTPSPSIEGVVNGIRSEITDWPKITEVSESPKDNKPAAIKVTLNDTDITEYYDFTWDFGKLEITPFEITIKVNDWRIPYGDEPSNGGATIVIAEGTTIPGTIDTAEVINRLSYYYPDYTKGQDVGTYTIKANADDAIAYIQDTLGGNYQVGVEDGNLIVEKRQVSIAPADQTITYGDKVLTSIPANATAEQYALFTFKNMFSGDDIATVAPDLSGITLEYSDAEGHPYYDGDFVGEYVISHTMPVTRIETTNYYFEYEFVDPTSQTPTKVLGKLTVEKKPITLKAADGEKVYDGTPLTNGNITIDPVDGIVTEFGDFITDVVVEGTITNVGTADNVITSYSILRSNRATDAIDVSENYDVTLEKGTLTVNAAEITVTAKDDTKIYDGTPLTNSDYTITVEDETGEMVTYTLPAGFTAEVEVTGTITFYSEDGVENVVGNVTIKDAESNDVTENYTITKVNGTLTIKKRDIIVTAPTTSWVYDGTVHTDNAVTCDNLATTDTVVATMTDESQIKDVGTCANVIDSLVFTNTTEGDATDSYNVIAKVDGLLEVTARTVVLSGAVVETKPYDGTTEATLDLTSAVVAYIDPENPNADPVEDTVFAADLAAGNIEVSYTATFDNKNAGSEKTVNVAVTLTGEGAANYVFEDFTLTGEITKVKVTVTPKDNTIVYEEAPAAAGYEITGFVNDETEEGLRELQELSGEPNLVCNYTQYQNISEGPFTITAEIGTLEATNYEFVMGDPATLTVEKADMEGTVTNVDVVYDDLYHAVLLTMDKPVAPANFDLTIEYSENGETWQSSNFQYHDAMEEQTVYFKVTDSIGNYNEYTNSGTIVIHKKPLQVIAKTFNIEYGDPSPVWDVTAVDFNAFAGNDDYRDLFGTLVLSCDYVPYENANVREYPIIPSGYESNNYEITFVEGVLNIGKTDLYVYIGERVEVEDPETGAVSERAEITITYGDTLNIDELLTWVGFIEGEDESVLDGELVATIEYNPYIFRDASTATFSDVGNYAVTFSGVTSGNYAIHFLPVTVYVVQKRIEVTPDELSKVYGDPDPEFTYVLDNDLVGEDKIIGKIEREQGENVGQYALSKGTIAIVHGDDTEAGMNYTIYFVTGKYFTITQKTLTVTPVDITVDYGNTTVPNYSVTYDAFAFDEDESVLNGQLSITCDYDPTVREKRDAGTYDIIASGYPEDNGNYRVVFVVGTLTVNPVQLTITAEDKTITYGDPIPDYTEAYEGFVYDDADDKYDLEGEIVFECAYDPEDPDNRGAGKYAINVSGVTSNNYVIEFVAGELTVEKAQLKVTADDKTITYGDPAPDYTATVETYLYDDNDESINLTFECEYEQGDDAGTYEIVPSATSDNYDIELVSGTLTVLPKEITITVEDKEITYGDPIPDYTAIAEVLYEEDSLEDLDLSFECAYDPEDPDNRGAGTYEITVTYKNGNYDAQIIAGTLTVNKLGLKIIADNIEVVYGDDPEFTVTYDAFIYDDDESVLIGELDFDCDYVKETATAGDTYTITPKGVTADNYEIEFVDGTLTVIKADLTITPKSQTVEYGEALAAFETDFVGFKNGETLYTFGIVPVYDCDYQIGKGITTEDNRYYLRIVIDDDTMAALQVNYNVTVEEAEIIVVPATLTVEFAYAETIYGQPAPELEILKITGYKNNEGEEVIKSYGIITEYEVGDPVGFYDILEDPENPFTADNYVFTFIGEDKLEVKPLAVTITIDNKTITYGDPAPEFTVTVDSYYGDDTFADLGIELSTDYEQGDGAGEYKITATVVSEGNYTFELPADGVLTVEKAALTISVDDNSITYGDDAPTFTYTAEGFVLDDTVADLGGSISYTYEYNKNDPEKRGAGDYVVTASGFTSDNYEIEFVAGTLTVLKKAITVTVTVDPIAYGDPQPSQDMYTAEPQAIDGESPLEYEDTVDDLALEFSTVYEPGNPVGEYAISAVSDAANYTVTFEYGTLVVEKKALKVIADDIEINYGDPIPEYTVTYDTLVLDETADVLGGELVIECAYDPEDPQSRNAGTYPITVSGLTSDNYEIEFVEGTLTVKKVALTIVVDDKEIKYGDNIPNYTSTIEGEFAYDESLAGFQVTILYSCEYELGSGIGEYTITIKDVDLPNYEITVVDGTLTVEPATLTITYSDYEISYGDPAPEFVITSITGFVNNETKQSLIQLGTFTEGTLVCEYVQGDDAGTYPIVPDGFEADNYIFVTDAEHNLVVKPLAITITVTPGITKVYGSEDPAFTYTTDVAPYGADTFVLTREAGEDVGEYAITCEANPNYDITFVGNVLTITPKDLFITPVAASKVYGTEDPAFTYTAIGFAFDDDESLLTGAIGRQPGENVGEYEFTLGTLSAGSNYNLVLDAEDVGFTITKADLTLTAKDVTIVYGTEPFFTEYTLEGLTNGDALSGEISFSTDYEKFDDVGTYTITITYTGALEGNYNVTCVSGTLTVTQATADITASAENTSKLVNDAQVFGAIARATFAGVEGDPNTVTVKVVVDGEVVATVDCTSGTAIEQVLDTLTAGTHTVQFVFDGNTNYGAVSSEEVTIDLVTLEYVFTTGDVNTVTNVATETTKAAVEEHLAAAIPGSEVTLADIEGYVGTGYEITVDGTTYAVLIVADVNGDGMIDAKDIAALQKVILELSTVEGVYAIAADVNGDGRYNSRDIAGIQRLLVA